MDRQGWNRRYAGDGLVWKADPNRFLVAEIAGLQAGRALDLASGEGRNAIWLAERGWRVDAVDFSEVAVDKARKLGEQRGVRVDWIVEDVEAYEPESRVYDLVIVFYLHMPWDILRPVLARAAAAVAPGGTFLLVGHDRSNLERGYGGPRDPAVLYTAEDVAATLGDLRIVEAGLRRRPVETEAGEATAIDCLVRAVAEARGEPR